jgi:hypothetical protein
MMAFVLGLQFCRVCPSLIVDASKPGKISIAMFISTVIPYGNIVKILKFTIFSFWHLLSYNSNTEDQSGRNNKWVSPAP